SPTQRHTRHGELEPGEVASGEMARSPARSETFFQRPSSPASSSRELRTPNAFPNRSWSASNALRNAPPLSSRYEDGLTEPGIISNDLDGAQSRQIAGESHARPNRPVARPIMGTSRRDYGYVRTNPAVTARRAALQLLDTYTCGPSAITTDEVVQRQTLRERYLTPQVTTTAEDRERLRQQLKGEPVPSMQTVPVVLAEGETTGAYEAQFQNWMGLARRLRSDDALRASFSETDIRLERRLRFDFAKRQTKRRTSGQRPSRYEAPPPPAPAIDSPAHDHEPAATATGQSPSPAIDLSSPHSSSGKRVAPGDSVARPSGDSSTSDPDHKRQRRQDSPAVVAPRTPTSSVNAGNLATSQDTGFDPGVDAAPSGAPHGCGTPLARRAEHEEDERPLDSLAASFVEFLSLRSHARSVSAYVAGVDRSSHRLANDLEDVERHVGWLESLQAMQQRGADLERQVAQLQGQLDLLVRMQPYGSHPVAMQPPMTLPPAALQPPMALQLPATPQYPVYSYSGAGLQHPAVSQTPATSQPSSDPALAPQSSPEQGPGMA
ncbi:hypothetical protein F442_05924, partial [Phytophthora nicotianae P10297]